MNPFNKNFNQNPMLNKIQTKKVTAYIFMNQGALALVSYPDDNSVCYLHTFGSIAMAESHKKHESILQPCDIVPIDYIDLCQRKSDLEKEIGRKIKMPAMFDYESELGQYFYNLMKEASEVSKIQKSI